ncbi:MAG: transaldolase [Caldilineaceae bacterium]
MTKLQEAYDQIGQSIWLDYIRRSLMTSGELEQLIKDGLRGLTSNPSIFAEAIGESEDYDQTIQQLMQERKSVDQIYEALALEDIRAAADRFRPLYDASDYSDGYVSWEANPALAHDTKGTIKEARRLFTLADRPNVMIKVPATTEGIPAISTLIGEGININVTLMFSLEHYEAVSEAYLQGMEVLAQREGDLPRLASVASFFVSRVDSEVDERLTAIGNQDLQGKIGIANAKMAYAHYLTTFSSARWNRLAKLGAKPQRILFGSTSVKNSAYPDTLYVDSLMGANTVNTLPRNTIQAMREHATIAPGLTKDLEEARRQLVRLAQLGIDLAEVTQKLQNVGVDKFVKSFLTLQEAITQKISA